ncbi:MAG: type II toxin-antitoxin system VapC family toxin [Myxococcota bacterium]
MILLDTCVVSEMARPAPDARVLAWMESVPDDALRLSVLTIGEIQKGVALLEDGPRRERVEAWLAGLLRTFADRIVPVDQEVALCWGTISAACRRAGRVRPPVDGLLAATALRYQLTLATRNVSDFEGTGVAVVNPWELGRPAR